MKLVYRAKQEDATRQVIEYYHSLNWPNKQPEARMKRMKINIQDLLAADRPRLEREILRQFPGNYKIDRYTLN